ncbi:MAG: hypothetical protein LUJ09_05870, partial [Firmicutes bacterium]|nr:hypothetical protein [Bacillota bacterium]
TIDSTELTATGTEGDTSTYTSDDILAAVDEAMPAGYALAYEDSVTDQTVTYGDSGSVNVQIGKVATLTVIYQKYNGRLRMTTVRIVTLTKVQTSAASRAIFTPAEIKAAAPSGYKVLLATSATVRYGANSTKTVTVY